MPDGDDVSRIIDLAARRAAEMTPVPGINPMDFGETDVARRFAAARAGQLVYDHDDRSWFRWTGNIWLKDNTAAAMETVKRFVEDERRRVLLPQDDKAMSKVKFVRAVEEAARSDPHMAVHGAMWDADGWLLGTPDGVVDLRTGEMRPGRPKDYIARHTLVAPAAPGTAAPHWTAFLHEATQGDEDLMRFLQRWAGYCLTGDVSEEVLCFLYGGGGNGKGVYTGVLSAIMGPYAVAMPIEAFTAGGRQNQEYYRAQMAGARLVTASETESGRHWAEAQIKELTGNETPVSARQPHGRVYTYTPQCKLHFVGNHAPSLKGRSPAMERRLRIIPFEHTPANPDLDLKAKLIPEYPAILRWAIDGALDWRDDRLGTATAIQKASGEYFEKQDVFGRWMEDRCILDNSLSCPPGALFADYRGWCQGNGETPLSSPEFAEKIDRTKGLKRKKTSSTRTVLGIGLRPSGEDRYER